MSTDKTRDTSQPSAPTATRKEPSTSGVRARILAAAAELAKEKGAAHIPLEAIAQRAGLSKGGLLYHFPRKDALLQALVAQHMAEIEAELADVEAANGHRRSNAVARAFVGVHRKLVCRRKSKFDGLLVALAESPNLLDPIRDHEKRVVERIRNTAADRELSLIALLVIEGIRALELLEMSEILHDEECVAVIERILTMLAEEPEDARDSETK